MCGFEAYLWLGETCCYILFIFGVVLTTIQKAMKITIYQLVFYSLLVLTVMSCKKEPTPEVKIAEVYAGVHDASFHYYEFVSPDSISISWDAQNLYGVGSDSLDIDSNGAYDFFISLYIVNQDSLHLLTGVPNPIPSCVISTKNGLEVAYYIETYAIGLGQTASANFVDRLDYNERIDLISAWHTNITMWCEPPGSTLPNGDWYSATTESYMAIKMNGNKYGWIKLNAFDQENPKIISYAIQN